jgi:hypothetical protein
MGNHTLISVSHDLYGDQDSSWIGALGDVVQSGSRQAAATLERTSNGAIKVIATRHSSEPFYVSREVEGFPTQLPYDEQLDAENAAWEAAQTKARAWLGRGLKLRTIAQVRDLVVQLMARHKTSDAQILAADGAYLASRKLADTQWRPTRADYESLKNRLAKIDQTLGETQ